MYFYKSFISIIIWPVWIIFMFFGLVILFISLYFISLKNFHYILRPFCWLSCFFAGQWLVKEGNIPNGEDAPYLYMFNHVSMFDQFMVVAYLKHYTTAIGAHEEFRWPIFGAVAKKYGGIPIDRKHLKKAIGTLKAAEKIIREGTSIIIAPEGTRTVTGAIGNFKKGPFHLALNTGATIVPVALINAFEAKKKTDWRLKPGMIKAKFGNPIHFSNYSNLSVEELRDFVKNKIQNLLK
ncbi:MAG: hypothetical protein CMG67_00220 [Candidatus Marinimicrobia bacterium]|nr:hypothetical protein [Candidatus Neomarinimicrobiota bacterium]